MQDRRCGVFSVPAAFCRDRHGTTTWTDSLGLGHADIIYLRNSFTFAVLVEKSFNDYGISESLPAFLDEMAFKDMVLRIGSLGPKFGLCTELWYKRKFIGQEEIDSI